MSDERNIWATAWLRGLRRLLPLPWANKTKPRAFAGISRSPASVTSSAGICSGIDRDFTLEGHSPQCGFHLPIAAERQAAFARCDRESRAQRQQQPRHSSGYHLVQLRFVGSVL
jgi:hypothetical protein